MYSEYTALAPCHPKLQIAFFFFPQKWKVLFSFLSLMKVCSSCNIQLYRHIVQCSLELHIEYLLYASQKSELANSTKQKVWEGSAQVAWHWSACLPPLSSPMWVWDACQGAVPGFRDFPFHPVVSKHVEQLQLFSLVPRMGKLCILSTCHLGGSQWKETS